MKTLITLFALLSFNLSAQQNVFSLSTPFDIAYVDFEVYSENIYAVTVQESTQGDGIRGPIICKLPTDGSPGELKKLLVPDSLRNGLYSAVKQCNLSDDFVAVFYSSEDCETYIVKFKPSLNVIWCKVLNFPPTTNMHASYMSTNLLTITAQDDIIISLAPNLGSILTRLDSYGNMIFSKKITNGGDPSGMNPGLSFIATSDGGYLLTMGSDWMPAVVKLNAALEVEWSKRFAFSNYTSLRMSQELSNGNFVMILEETQTKIAEFNPQGELISIKQGVAFTFPYTMNALSNGNYEIFDHNGVHFKSNSSGGPSLVSTFDHTSYGLPIFRNGNRYVYNRTPIYSFYFVVNDQGSSCYDMIVDSVELSNVSLDSIDISNEPISIEDFGSINNFTNNWVTDNTIFVTETCGTLANEDLDYSVVNIYPNPSSTTATISLQLNSKTVDQVHILNAVGQEVMTINSIDNDLVQFTLNQTAGIYFIIAYDKNGNRLGSEKLVLE